MGQGHTRRMDDHSSQCTRPAQGIPRLQAVLSLVEGHQIFSDKLHPLQAHHIGERLPEFTDKCFHTMTECVKTHACQNTFRHGHHTFRIYNGSFCNNSVAAQGFFIAVKRVCQHRKTVTLASGPAGRRDQDNRQSKAALSPSEYVIIDVSVIHT